MKSVSLTILSVLALIISWIVFIATIFMYIMLPIGHIKHSPESTKSWLQLLHSFFYNHFYLFIFLSFFVSVIIFIVILRRGKDTALYKILFYNAVLNFLFGIAGLFFKLAGHGQEVDGFEWITAGGTFGALLLVWCLQITMPFLKPKAIQNNV